MTIKIYLAGSAIENSEKDWRLNIVKTLKPTYEQKEERNIFSYWKHAKSGIMSGMDYTGPFIEESSYKYMDRYRKAIQDADIVFAWSFNGMYSDDVGRLSAELGYARALNKLIAIGNKGNELDIQDIYFAYNFTSYFPFGFEADTPKQSFIKSLEYLVIFLPIEQQIEFYHSNRIARQFYPKNDQHDDDFSRCGYVYIIKADTGHYKIGRTKNVPNRMKIFGIKLPFEFDIIHVIPCENMYDAESALHIYFDSQRVNGEWFNLSDDDVDFIKQMKEYHHKYFDSFDDDYLLLYYNGEVEAYRDGQTSNK